MPSLSELRRRWPWTGLLVLAVACTLAGAVGRATRPEDSALALVWPAAAVGFLWVLAAWGDRRLLRRDLAALAVVVAALNAATGVPLGPAIGLGAANALQALAAVALLHRLAPHPGRLRTPGDLGALVAAAVGGAVLSGAVGPAVLWLHSGGDLALSALAWVVRNAASTFLLSAPLLRLLDRGRPRERSRPRTELLLAVVVLLLAYQLVFGVDQGLPAAFLLLPLSLLGALRYGATVAAAHALVVGVLVVAGTLAGDGPFGHLPPVEQALLVQAYVSVAALLALALALFREDREELYGRLQQAYGSATEQAAMLSGLLETVDVGVVACDAAGRLTLFNRTTREFHGMPEDPGLDPADWADRYALFAEDSATPLSADRVPLLRALRDGEVRDAVIVIAPHGLPARVVRCDGRRLHGPDGRVLGAVVAMADVTAARAARRALEEREQRFRAAFQDSPTPVAYVSPAGTVTDVNAALLRLLGTGREALVDRPLEAMVPGPDRGALTAALRGEGTGAQPVEVRVRRADGTCLWVELATTRSSDLAGRPFLLAQLLDVDARKQQEALLVAAARTDPLTGLANRAALADRLADLLARPVDAGAVLLYLDLDGFKAVNDTAGHEAGDAVLREVARRLSAAVRPGDLVARLGGDEFVVLAHPPAGDPAAGGPAAGGPGQALADRLATLLARPVEHGDRLLQVGASVGVAALVAGSTPEQVLRHGDREMYRAKRARRATVPGPRAELPTELPAELPAELPVSPARGA